MGMSILLSLISQPVRKNYGFLTEQQQEQVLPWVFGDANIIKASVVLNDYLIFQMGSFTSQYPAFMVSYNSLTADTTLLSDDQFLLSIYEANMVQVGNELFFPEFNDYYVSDLWKTGGTREGTSTFYTNLNDFNSVTEFEEAAGFLFLPLPYDQANQASAGDEGYRELAQSNLTSAGTVFVTDLFPGLGLDLDSSGNYTGTTAGLFFTLAMPPAVTSPSPLAALYFYDPVPIVTASKTSTHTSGVLKQNYPNPFVSNTTISFDLVKTENVVLEIINTYGEVVAVPVFGAFPAGKHEILVTMDLKKGTYYYRLKTDNFSETMKMISY